MSSTSGTSGSGRRRMCETGVSSDGSWTRNFSVMRRWFALQIEDERRFFDD